MSENEFLQDGQNSEKFTFGEAGRMKPGSLCMMKASDVAGGSEGFPCKVTAMSTAKPGKHGSAKAMIVAKDIFTEKQHEETFGTSDNCKVPIVKKTEYSCIDIDTETGNLTLMEQETGECREDINLPEEGHLNQLKKDILANFAAEKKETLVTVQDFDGHVQVCGFRTGEEM